MKRYLPATIIAVAIVVLGVFFYFGLSNIAYKDRAVSVRGLAEKEVKADLVTWPISYKMLGDELPELYDQVEGQNNVIIKFLTDNGISRNEIMVGSPSVYDRDTQEYSSHTNPYRYTLTSTLVVTSSNVDLVNEVILKQGELLKQGISLNRDYGSDPVYEFTGLNEIKPAMIAEATAKAREAAQKFAEDSESELGGIKNAEQGLFSIEDRDSFTPYIKKVRVVTYITYYLK